MNDAAEAAQSDRVECPAARDPAVRLFIFAGMLIVFGSWCFYDAFVSGKYPYPEDGNLNGLVTYYFNHGGGIVLPLAGLVPLAWAIVLLKRKLVATAEGIGYEGKPPIAWQSITRLDASLLAEKGLLHLHHGGRKPFTLDSWKLGNFKAMVAFVERHVPPEAIDKTPDAAPAAADDEEQP